MCKTLRMTTWWLLVAAVPWSAAQEPTSPPVWQVDGASAYQFVAHLSADAMQGRASGTDCFRQAAEWAAANFQQWGLRPAGEGGTYFQSVRLHPHEFNAGVPQLRVGARDFPIVDGDFSVVSRASSPGVSVVSEVIFVGYGIAAPDLGLDEYAGVEVQGKVVLIFRGSPYTAPPPWRPFESSVPVPASDAADPWAAQVEDQEKVRTAYARGAAAVLLVDPDEVTEPGRPRRFDRSPVQVTLSAERPFLTFTVNDRVFRAIVQSDPQETARGLRRRFDALRRDIQARQARSFATGVTVTLRGYDQSLRFSEEEGNNRANNVLAMIEGTDPELKQQVVLVGAHLDHIGADRGFIFNGADDNASGSAVVLEVARVLGQGQFQPRRTLVFALWTGEELGLLGSLHYTKQPCAGVTMDNIVSSFNLDMVGMGDRLNAYGALNFPSIWEVMCRHQDPEILEMLQPNTGGPGGSDHTGFIRQGIQTVFLMSQGGIGHPDYHQPEDDLERIDAETLRRTGQFVLQATMNVAEETEVNLLIDRRQDLYNALHLQVANFNPQLPDSSWSVVDVPATNRDELIGQLIEQVRQLRAAHGSAADAERTARSPERGLRHVEPVGDDVPLLELVAELYGVGRIDIAADDSFWVTDGKLSAAGQAMLAALEQRDFVLHLISPHPQLLADVLQATSKPFVVTGDYQLDKELAAQVSAREVLCGVDLDPHAVDDFLRRVEQLKGVLGARTNLFAYLVTTDGLDAAKAHLYLGLLDLGWAREEIASGREHRGLLGGATLNKLGR